MLLCKILFAQLLLLVCNYTKAQLSAGMEAGFSNNHCNTDISSMTSTRNKNKNGYNIGIIAIYNLKRTIAIKTGISLLQKNYSFFRTNEFAGIFEVYRNTYIQIPTSFQLSLFENNKFKTYFSVGGYVGYWAFGKVKGAMPNIFNSYDSINNSGQIAQYLSSSNYSEKYQFNNAKDNRIELGWLLGIGTDFSLNKKHTFFIECNYYQSTTNQQKKYMLNQANKFNQTILVSFGVLYSFTAKKK
jgi:hypothetical protein